MATNNDYTAPLKRIAGHDCFEYARRCGARLIECGICKVTWWQRNRLTWEVLDMECPCGARGWSEDTSSEWGTDTECPKCYKTRVEKTELSANDDYTRHHELGIQHIDFLLYRLEERNGELADKDRRIANLRSLLARERYWHRLFKAAHGIELRVHQADPKA